MTSVAPWIEHLARVGYAAKALLYITVGLIATGGGMGRGGRAVDTQGALRAVHGATFGRVALVRSTPRPSRVVLFVSGDGGWKTGVVDMAGHLAAKDALVVGIDIRHYMKSIAAARESCAYSAADFEGLSQYVQKTLGYPRYVTPILAGYSSGATLVYALLAQAPPGTFAGALSLGFCPDLPGKPLCKGRELEHDEHGGKGSRHLQGPPKVTAICRGTN